ncbi:MAG TPA: PH domain-containing protein [Coxiellaceae bacterium]|nr:PH domain-containing protein [Coxiellaceae bacterium]
MSYLQKTLLPNEKIVYATIPHWIVFMPAITGIVVTFILFIWGNEFLPNLFPLFGFTVSNFAALIAFLYTVYQLFLNWVLYTQSEYGITDQRILAKWGWIQRNTTELLLQKVESIRVEQTVAGRIWGYGTLIITGTGGTRDVFLDVPNPLKFRELAQAQMEMLFSAERGSSK